MCLFYKSVFYHSGDVLLLGQVFISGRVFEI